MFYATLHDYEPDLFKRLTGVSKDTFTLMEEVLSNNIRDFGRPPELCLQDRLLMVLMYWREYRSQAHIGATYGVSESTVCRTIKRFENILIGDTRFHLPGKKALRPGETVVEVVVVDATECPCERPKKDRSATTRARRSSTPTKPR